MKTSSNRRLYSSPLQLCRMIKFYFHGFSHRSVEWNNQTHRSPFFYCSNYIICMVHVKWKSIHLLRPKDRCQYRYQWFYNSSIHYLPKKKNIYTNLLFAERFFDQMRRINLDFTCSSVIPINLWRGEEIKNKIIQTNDSETK